MKPYSPPLSIHAFRSPLPAIVYGVLGIASVYFASSPGTYVFSALPLFAGTAYFVWSLQRAKATVYFALRAYSRDTSLVDVFVRQIAHYYGTQAATRKVRLAYAEAVNFYTYSLIHPYLAARGVQFALFAILALIECALIGANSDVADTQAVLLGMLWSLTVVPEIVIARMLYRSHRSDMTAWVTARLGLR